MAIITLIIGIVLLAIGFTGQTLTRSKKPAAHPGDRRSFRLVITVGSIVIGAWLLIISAVQLLHAHQAALHS
jgi:transcriptional regulator GlxA family with amidase domain